ncbi:uncharacterized protein LOC112686798 [Sipha flava]|uniref:Uncharacterized protein LOC112686798 n=1 Tax=Sipha flava TaxID=143950 RepID=A0A8B8FW02_9HEMI|nr:uncharacterized protein LOC112686798 [Sipha flava]
MRSVSLTVTIAWAVCAHLVCYANGVEFEQQRQLQADHGYDYYSEGPLSSAAIEQLSRTHHGKLKMKKLKKRLLLQCLLGHGQRRRRDTEAASGRFLLPVVLQSTNVNVGPTGSGGHFGDPQQHGSYGGGCMEMLNDHGPLGVLGSLGSFGSSTADATGEGSRNGLYTDWNRYGRQFHRNFVRPLYRLF